MFGKGWCEDSNNASGSRGGKTKKVVDPSMPNFDLDTELNNSAESKQGGKGDDKDCNTVTHLWSEPEEIPNDVAGQEAEDERNTVNVIATAASGYSLLQKFAVTEKKWVLSMKLMK
ncbi:hypothetical protein DM860_006923 [Cuscuta australis]|uniref:Uncharacterized protein n=1 Tax=Cuscuta australis TaxID=267555 RepID=A0A328E9S2_9ASTE|nr:hypothetical protein DM860_006923 [Cuscuta australis]